MFYINDMKKWLAISLSEHPKGASLNMAFVSGNFKEGFRIQPPHKLDFPLGSLGTMEWLSQHMNIQILRTIGTTLPQQRVIPIVIGVQPSILLWLKWSLGLEQESSLHQVSDLLGNLWTDLLKRAKHKAEIIIHPAGFVDELEWWMKLQDDIPEDVATALHALVNNIGRDQNLNTLQEMAFQDGADSVESYRLSDPSIRADRIQRFSIFGHTFGSERARVRFNYLSSHPLLKNAFVAWMLSKGAWSLRDIHHVCVKTPLDPKAPPYSNIAITMLADECARDEGRVPVGHIQEMV